MSGTKLRVGKGVIEHRCPGCDAVHSINVHELNRDGKVIGWDGDRERPSFGETVTLQTANGPCEYVMRAGVQYFTDNCWHGLKNQARHLQEI